MRFLITILILAGSYLPNYSQQTNQANQWMLGWIGKMDFNNSTSQYYVTGDTIKLLETNAGICDSNGQILMWTNGAAVFNAAGDTMQNGVLYHVPYSQNFAQVGMPLYQGALILPHPANNDSYILFHSSLDFFNTAPPNFTLRSNIYYSIIDTSANGGLGGVVNNSQFLEDSIHWGNMIAIKHGNGRDWWVISHEISSANWFMWLISPQGVSLAHKQTIASTTLGTPSVDRSIGQMSFSPDGTHFAFMLGFGGGSYRIEIMDFDRCTGLFGSVLKSDQPSIVNNPSFIGTQFSPSGRYLYITSTTALSQYDLQASNFAASRVLIDTYNGTQAPFSATFSHMKLAPDGKIYCHASNGNWTLHVINDPDSLGTSCNFVQNGFWPSNNSLNICSLPNIPNFELGSIPGSPCDTILSVSNPEAITHIAIYPNPSSNFITIEYNQLSEFDNFSFKIIDIAGRVVIEKNIENNSNQTIVDISSISPGSYQIFFNSGNKHISKKLIVVR